MKCGQKWAEGMIYNHWECDPMARVMYHYLRVELSEPLLGSFEDKEKSNSKFMISNKQKHIIKEDHGVSDDELQTLNAKALEEKREQLRVARALAKEERDHFYAAFRAKYEN